MDRIKQAREAAGYSQERLAVLLGTTRTTLGSWESGTTEPKVSQIREMCKLFGCTADYLLELDEEQKS